MVLETKWECEDCGARSVFEKRNGWVFRTETKPTKPVQACSHPHRLSPNGGYFCARCGYGPLKEPFMVDGGVYGSECKDIVASQPTPTLVEA